MAAIQLATVVSLTPGNVGVYEAATVAVYQQLGVPPAVAFPLALTHHLLLLLALIGPGYLFLVAHAAGPARGTARVRAVIVWAHLLLFGALIGIVALFRNFDRRGKGRHWRGMHDDASSDPPSFHRGEHHEPMRD